VLPGKTASRMPCSLQALAGTGKVGIGKFVMRQHEYLAATRSDGEHLTLSTLAYPDEVVDPAEVEDLESVVGVAISDRELAMAGTLVEAMCGPVRPSRLQRRVPRSGDGADRSQGRRPDQMVEAAPDRAQVVDLAAALEASVEASKASRSRHPTARPSAKNCAAEAEAAPRPRVKKSA